MPNALTASAPHTNASARLMLAGERISLGEWLEVSWFFPPHFKKEKIAETKSAYLVFGGQLVYKFHKQKDSAHSPLSSALQEAAANADLAPGVYLTIEPLRWEDEEPSWGRSISACRLEVDGAGVCDDAAIVMRRLPDNTLLSNRLQGAKKIRREQGEALGRTIRRFHERNALRSAGSEAARDLLRELRVNLLHRIASFCRDYGSFLDSFSNLALQESKNFLEVFLREHEQALLQRYSGGCLVDGHGALDPDNIWLDPLSRNQDEFIILNRRVSDRLLDPLQDLAALVSAVEVAGASDIARSIESGYFTHDLLEEEEDLYAFYLCSAALKRSLDLLQTNDGDELYDAQKFLSLSFRYANGLRKPFLVALSGLSPDDAELVANLAEFSGAKKLTFAQEQVLPGGPIADGRTFNRLLSKARREIERGRPVVLSWPLKREEERYTVAKLAHELGIRYLLVKCVLSAPEKTRRRLAGNTLPEGTEAACFFSDFPWNTSLSTELRQLVLETILPQAELVLYILQELKKRKQILSAYARRKGRS